MSTIKSLLIFVFFILGISLGCFAQTAYEWYQKGKATDSYEDKVQYYTNALKLNPNYARAYYHRGLTLNKLEEYNAAIEDFSKVVELDSAHTFTFISRGDSYKHLGQKEDAIIDYTKAINLDTQNPWGYRTVSV